MERAERAILAPARDWLSAAEVADWLGVSEVRLRRMVRRGEFPRPADVGRKCWPWLDVVAWAHLRSRGWPEAAPARERPRKNPPAGGGR